MNVILLRRFCGENLSIIQWFRVLFGAEVLLVLYCDRELTH